MSPTIPGTAATGSRSGEVDARARRRRRCHAMLRARDGRPVGSSLMRVAHPRIEVAVEQVGDEVGDDQRRAEQQEQTLQHRVVGPVDRLQRRLAETGPREDRLDRDRARQHEPEVERDRLTTGSSAFGTACRRRTSDVAQALGASELEVVLAHRVEQRRPHDDRVLAEVGERERERRAATCGGPGRGAGRDRVGGRPGSSARRSGTARADRERAEQQHPEPEVGHRVGEHRERRRRERRTTRRRQPAWIPSSTPITIDSSVDVPTSRIVGQTARGSRSMTGVGSASETPRLPCAVSRT